MRRLEALAWHTRGSYLYYLSQAPHEFFVLSKPGRPAGYGRCANFDCMRDLLRSPSLARDLGQAARRRAQERFSIGRFSAAWDAALRHVTRQAG